MHKIHDMHIETFFMHDNCPIYNAKMKNYDFSIAVNTSRSFLHTNELSFKIMTYEEWEVI